MKVGSSGGMNRFRNVRPRWQRQGVVLEPAERLPAHILGGAWDEPAYLFNDPDARAPIDRGAKLRPSGRQNSAGESGDDRCLVAFEARDFRNEKPVGDDVFAAYARSTSMTGPTWRRGQTPPMIRARMAHRTGVVRGGLRRRRVPAIVYLRSSQASVQAIVYFPNSGVLTQRSSAQVNVRAFDWVMKSGRP